jgi:hypothetical protein
LYISVEQEKSTGMNASSGRNSGEGPAIYRPQLITIEDLAAFKDDLLHEIKKILIGNSSAPEKKFLRSSEVRKMLSISAGTLQNLRVNGRLPYTKVGGIFFYDQKDIANLLGGLPSYAKASAGDAVHGPQQCSSNRK